MEISVHQMLKLLHIVILMGIQCAAPAKILAIFPHIGRSHFDVFEPYVKELASRGHHVFVLSHFPQKTPVESYTDISLEGSFPLLPSREGIAFQDVESATALKEALLLSKLGLETCNRVLNFTTTQKLIHSDMKFDLVIYELFNTDCFLGFVHKFQTPSIAVSSSLIMPWGSARFANPDTPSYIPTGVCIRGNEMSFFERLVNTVDLILYKTLYYFIYNIPGHQIAKKYFGESLPPLYEIAKNTSLMLVNTHFSLNRPRPLVPAIIDVGGIHLRKKNGLPKDIEEFLSNATNGVVYFSMGSMIKAETFPVGKREAFLHAFANLPQKVLWKWEGDVLPNQPENVFIKKWLPQFDVLCHPNVQVFISHGGMLGTMEAVHCGVPIVGIPMYGDQPTNVGAIVTAKAGVMVDYNDISKETVLKALRTVLENNSFKHNADRLSRAFKDRPMTPLDTAVYWTEYVIRHKGARHLRSAAVDIPFLQFYLIDVIVAIIVILASILFVFLTTIRKIRLCIC